MKWIKSRERLPNEGGLYIVRDGSNVAVWTRSVLDIRTRRLINQNADCRLEWLDESPATPEGKEEIIEEIVTKTWKANSAILIGELDTEEEAAEWIGIPLMREQDYYEAIEEYLTSRQPSAPAAEEVKGIEAITGFKTIAEGVAYDKGRSDEEKVIIGWIENWDGKTNSGMGELLDRKFKEYGQQLPTEEECFRGAIVFCEGISTAKEYIFHEYQIKDLIKYCQTPKK